MINLNNLLTEKRNPYTLNIDNVSTLEMCMLLNEEDKRVAIAKIGRASCRERV